MRNVFSEGDVISAEVQSFFSDGSIALHTRSLKYGKVLLRLLSSSCQPPLNHTYRHPPTHTHTHTHTLSLSLHDLLQLKLGVLVRVTPTLVRRSKQHFDTLPCGVDVIFGVNGFIWISPPKSDQVRPTLSPDTHSLSPVQTLAHARPSRQWCAAPNCPCHTWCPFLPLCLHRKWHRTEMGPTGEARPTTQHSNWHRPTVCEMSSHASTMQVIDPSQGPPRKAPGVSPSP